MKNVLIIEDDPLTADRLKSSIEREFSQEDLRIEVIETEAEFVLHWLPDFDRALNPPPTVIVIDVMLRWTDPDPNPPPRPQEVVEGGFMRAGLRCKERIRQRSGLSKSHLLFLTVLAREDLESLGGKIDGIEFFQKDNSDAALRSIRNALSLAGDT